MSDEHEYEPAHVLPPTEVIQQVATQAIPLPTIRPKRPDQDSLRELNLIRTLINASEPKRWVVLSVSAGHDRWIFEGIMSELELKAFMLKRTPGVFVRIFDLDSTPTPAETRFDHDAPLPSEA